MERKILRLLKFNVNFPEPFTFLFYFSKLVDIETNQVSFEYFTIFKMNIFIGEKVSAVVLQWPILARKFYTSFGFFVNVSFCISCYSFVFKSTKIRH